MNLTALIVWLVIGAIAGWLAGIVVKGRGFGLGGNIVVGIVGAALAGWLFPRFGFGMGGGLPGAVVSAAIGAIILLLLIQVVRKA